MLWSAFCGQTYQHRSSVLDAEQTINLIPIAVESKDNAKQKGLLGTPGLRLRLSVEDASCRGSFSEDGRTWTVIGTHLYELDLTTDTATELGTVADDGRPVFFASNGRGGEQLAIEAAGHLYIFELDTNVFIGDIALPLVNAARTVQFIDGYFVLLEVDTVRVWFSALEDGTSWDALDYFARSQTADNFVGMAVLNDRVFCFGSHTTEIYYDSGDADTPFVPYPGALIRTGIVGPWAWTIEGNALYWMAQDAQGRARCVRAQSVDAQRISTDAIDFALNSYARLDDVEAFSYWLEGTGVVGWHVPSAPHCGITWCITMPGGDWFQQLSWDSIVANFYRWRARGVCATANELLAGDFETGDLYEVTFDCFSENGQLIRRVRRAPYLSGEARFGFLDQIELGAQVGVGLTTGQGSEPQVMARVSRDGGFTWSPSVLASLGKIGEYVTRVVWRRLGRVRLDRFVFEVVCTEKVRVVFGPGLWLRITEGTKTL
jgi:hypothetical protein